MATVGIDLGTTNSCIGVWKADMKRVEILENDQGDKTTPSYVSFSGTQRLVGPSAKNQATSAPKNTVFDAKRLIGRKFSDKSVQGDIAHFPFNVTADSENRPLINVSYMNENKQFRPEDISAMVLGYLKKVAEEKLGNEVKNAVITVPAYFNDAQRQATKTAGRIAGLNVVRVINEPTAAAMAYGFEKDTSTEKTILVFDMGGGTFDVSLLTVCEGFYEVQATAGDTHLGGEDFDNIVVDFLAAKFKNKTGVDLKEDNPRGIRRLRSEVEKAKKALSSAASVNINVEAINGSLDFSWRLSRAKFEELCYKEFRKCLDPVKKVLSDSDIDKSKVDEIVMVGGSTRIPKVREIISKFFGDKKLNCTVNPDEAVAYGAAVCGAALSKDKDVKESVGDILLVDVAPLSLGVETQHGVMDVLVPSQKTIPTTAVKVYSTPKDNQTSVNIKIFEGERRLTKDNNLLGSFELSGIPPMPRGKPQVEITLKVEEDGILKVTAKELSVGDSKQLVIKNRERVTEEEVQAKIRDALLYKKQDEENAEKITQLNNFEEYVTAVRNSGETIKTLSDEDKSELQTICNESEDWIQENNGISMTLDSLKDFRRGIEGRVSLIYSKYSASEEDNRPPEDDKSTDPSDLSDISSDDDDDDDDNTEQEVNVN